MLTIVPTGISGNGSNYAVAGGTVPPTTNAGSQQYDESQKEIIFDFQVLLSGNYGGAATHGDTLDFTVASALGYALGVNPPTKVELEELVQAGVAATGFKFLYCPGATVTSGGSAGPQQNNGVVQILGTGAASGQGATEITEGSAYSSYTPSLANTVLKGRAWFPKYTN